MFKLTDAIRTQLQDSDLLWNIAHRISGQALVNIPREEAQRMHTMRKEMLVESMAILRNLAGPSGEAQPAEPQLAVKPPSRPAAAASGTTRRAAVGASDPAGAPVKVV